MVLDAFEVRIKNKKLVYAVIIKRVAWGVSATETGDLYSGSGSAGLGREEKE